MTVVMYHLLNFLRVPHHFSKLESPTPYEDYVSYFVSRFDAFGVRYGRLELIVVIASSCCIPSPSVPSIAKVAQFVFSVMLTRC